MNLTRQKQLAESLEIILATIIRDYAPQKIILLGSAVYQAAGEWSDLDLVIIKETSLSSMQRSKEIALLCPVWVGVDYLVYTPDEFQQMAVDKNPFIINEVLKKGIVLYERDATAEVA